MSVSTCVRGLAKLYPGRIYQSISEGNNIPNLSTNMYNLIKSKVFIVISLTIMMNRRI